VNVSGRDIIRTLLTRLEKTTKVLSQDIRCLEGDLNSGSHDTWKEYNPFDHDVRLIYIHWKMKYVTHYICEGHFTS
jgi:hypothetical protein